MSVKLLTGHNLEFPSLKKGCTGSSESTLVKIPHCWKSYLYLNLIIILTASWMGENFDQLVPIDQDQYCFIFEFFR